MGKGFTLIELLIVIGLLAILSTVAVLVINPAELLMQARDSQRVSDLGTVHSALGLYLATVSSPDFQNGLATTTCVVGGDQAVVTCSGSTRYSAGITATATTTVAIARATDATGWVRVNFGSIPGGSPLVGLPLDPVNDATYFYAYGHDTLKYELTANLERERYASSGTDDREGTDGGDSTTIYEVGNKLTI